MISRAKTFSVNRAPQPAAEDISFYCRDLNGWPRSWMGMEKDLPPGEQLLAAFRPFLDYLAASDLSRKTIRRHIDNLWLLGGEIIRDLYDDPSRRKLTAQWLLRDTVHADGGPLVHHGAEDEQRSFDATCRKLHRFLNQPSR